MFGKSGNATAAVCGINSLNYIHIYTLQNQGYVPNVMIVMIIVNILCLEQYIPPSKHSRLCYVEINLNNYIIKNYVIY